MKNSFVLYTSYMTQINLLSMEQRGVLLTAIMSYSSGDELPEMDGVTQMAFAFIKADMDRDAEKYHQTCEARKEAGKRGGRPNGKTLVTVSGKEIPPGEIEGKHFLYFILDTEENQYKIGETRNLFARRLSIHRPKAHLQIVDFYIGTADDCRRYEREVLKKYSEYSIGGDWFELPEEKVEEILTRYFSEKAIGFSEKQKILKKPDNEYEYEYEDDSKNNIPAPEYPYKEVVEYLNQKCGTRFKDRSKDTRTHIRARCEEGATLDDFKAVIDNRCAAWKNDPKMSEFLRPSTLFGPKFESYLNAKPGKKTNKFVNFQGRDYDFDALERALTGVNT